MFVDNKTDKKKENKEIKKNVFKIINFDPTSLNIVDQIASFE